MNVQRDVHEVQGNFVIAEGQVWLPGSYESRQAADFAFVFSYQALQDLQDAANQRAGGTGGTITMADLLAKGIA